MLFVILPNVEPGGREVFIGFYYYKENYESE